MLEPASSSVPPKNYTEHRLSKTPGEYELKNQNPQDVSLNATGDGSKAQLSHSSRAFLGLGKIGPLYNDRPPFGHEMVTLAKRPAGSPYSEEDLTGSIAREDTLMDGIRIEERYTSKTSNKYF